MDRTLAAILRPRSIAVVGASRQETSIGREILHNLIDGGFTGPIYPVNPNASSIHSIKCYPSLRDVPDPVDLAIGELRVKRQRDGSLADVGGRRKGVARVAEFFSVVAERVDSAVDGLKLLAQGKEINFDGASGPCDFNEIGDILDTKFRYEQAEKGKFKLLKIA